MATGAKQAFILAGTASGCGKTTITLGLLALLRQKGLAPQPFKVGPDYLDTTWHTAISGRKSRNLDNWMLPDDTVQALFSRAMETSSLGVVEGVMGLFDGLGIDPFCASTAGIARLLNLPVILLMDGKGVSTSLAATLNGFCDFAPGVNIAGVIINRVNTPNHFQQLSAALGRYCRVPVLGYVPEQPELHLPSRHLGLVGATGKSVNLEPWQKLAAVLEQTINLPLLLSRCQALPSLPVPPLLLPDPALADGLTMAVAQDDAFHFYYQDNLDIIEQSGVRLVPFSPLEDSQVPACDMLWLGGGYPEMFASQLAANHAMRTAVKQLAGRGVPVYAECGGLMYLGGSLADASGQTHAMCGVLAGHSTMGNRLKRFGYCEATANHDTLLAAAGETLRGHEFHYSEFTTSLPARQQCRKVRDGQLVRQWQGGWQQGNTFASYLHLHFAQRPAMLNRWFKTARSLQ